MHGRSRDRKILRNGGDLILLVAAYLAALFLARDHAGVPGAFLALSAREWLLLILLCMFWNFGARVIGLYDEFRIRAWSGEFSVLAASVFFHLLLAVMVLFAAKSQVLSRFFVFVYGVLLFATLALLRAALRLLLRRHLKNGHHHCRILVVGSGPNAGKFCATLAENPHMGMRVVGHVAERPGQGFACRHLGGIGELPRLLAGDGVDEVVIVLAGGENALVDRVEVQIHIGLLKNSRSEFI